MTEKYNVSIIIPTWNATQRTENDSPTIYKTVESINKQVVEDFKIEVLFVDDMSTDDTVKMIEKLIDKHPKINGKLFKLTAKAGSPYVGWNVGTEKSQSEYIMYADSDDYFGNSGSLFDMYKHAKKWNSDVVSGKLGNAGRGAAKNLYKFGNMSRIDLTIVNPVSAISTFGRMYKKSLLEENGIRYVEDIVPRADMHFLANVFLIDNLKSSLYADQDIYFWNQPEQNTLSQKMRQDDQFTIKRRKQFVRIIKLFKKSQNSIIKAGVLDKEVLGIALHDFFGKEGDSILQSDRKNDFLLIKELFNKYLEDQVFAYIDSETYYLVQLFKMMNFYEARNAFQSLRYYKMIRKDNISLMAKKIYLSKSSLSEILYTTNQYISIIGKQTLTNSISVYQKKLIIDTTDYNVRGHNRLLVCNRHDTKRVYHDIESPAEIIDLKLVLDRFSIGEKLDIFWEVETDNILISVPFKMYFFSEITDSYYKIFENYKGNVTIKKVNED
ncbi:hypothetical protein LH61_06490 [Leuconostoc mesenteroides P45]|uniref:glycosyltransferase family 2 protein n=1 Tax=Leuconostoc mesenteroides TaxID=1245 RepID=UPI0005018DFF|nr:glycosyltransferase family 2 protein [Leuconostoc mesenteroides]KGB51118.1 hypothetical protein LH61_06490 [Leuconostoc mesenteroides P45]